MPAKILLPLVLAGITTAQLYSLESSFQGPSFFDHFDFWTAPDPTIGYVHYVDQTTAEQHGMINYSSPVSWGVETAQVLDPLANLGRLSIRLTSKQSWTHGLFLLDLGRMPVNQCGVWPAFWTLGSGVWPSGGEVDIIEFENTLANNLVAVHTSDGCSIAGTGQTGTLLTNDCGEAEGFTGCGVSVKTPNNVGDSFNLNGGGVYAMEWTSTAIRVWFLPRPSTLNLALAATTGHVDIALFGTPVANFQGDCEIDRFFFNHRLVFDIDFCGTYAGNMWEAAGCPMLDPTNGWASCNAFVAAHPAAFQSAKWEVNYLNVYQMLDGSTPSPSSNQLSSSMPVASSSSVASAAMNAEGRSTTPSSPPKVSTSLSNTSPLQTGVPAQSSVDVSPLPTPTPTPVPDAAGIVTIIVVTEIIVMTTVVV